MRPNQGYQLREAMSKILEPFQGASESLCSGLGRLAIEHVSRRSPGCMHPITIGKET